MKRFTYKVLRRFCPACGGDGRGKLIPWRECWRCAGSGHLPEEPEPGQRHIVMVMDQSGRLVDIQVVAGTEPGAGRWRIVGFVVTLLVAALVLAWIVYVEG